MNTQQQRREEIEILDSYAGRDILSVRRLDAGRATHIMVELSREGIPVTADTLEIVARQGYDWRNQEPLNMVSPKTAVYFDCVVRLNELTHSGSFKEVSEQERYQAEAVAE